MPETLPPVEASAEERLATARSRLEQLTTQMSRTLPQHAFQEQIDEVANLRNEIFDLELLIKSKK